MIPGPPNHIVLEKDEEGKVKELEVTEEMLEEEFKQLEEFVQKTIVEETTVAGLKQNQPHNKQTSIGEGDGNVSTP